MIKFWSNWANFYLCQIFPGIMEYDFLKENDKKQFPYKKRRFMAEFQRYRLKDSKLQNKKELPTKCHKILSFCKGLTTIPWIVSPYLTPPPPPRSKNLPNNSSSCLTNPLYHFLGSKIFWTIFFSGHQSGVLTSCKIQVKISNGRSC